MAKAPDGSRRQSRLQERAGVEQELPTRVLECFMAVLPGDAGPMRVGICALDYVGSFRIRDRRATLEIEDCGGRSERAAARALWWAVKSSEAEAVILHVPGERLARQIEECKAGGGDEVAAAWLQGVSLRTDVVADRVDRPATPRMAEAASMARKGGILETLSAFS